MGKTLSPHVVCRYGIRSATRFDLSDEGQWSGPDGKPGGLEWEKPFSPHVVCRYGIRSAIRFDLSDEGQWSGPDGKPGGLEWEKPFPLM